MDFAPGARLPESGLKSISSSSDVTNADATWDIVEPRGQDEPSAEPPNDAEASVTASAIVSSGGSQVVVSDPVPETPNLTVALEAVAEQMDVDLRVLSQSLVATTEHLSHAPQFVKEFIHATRRLRQDLPEEAEVSENMKHVYARAHQELEQVEGCVTAWVVQLTKEKWASKGMISAFADIVKKMQITYAGGGTPLRYDPKLFELELKDLKSAAQKLSEVHQQYQQPDNFKGHSALKAVERVIPRAAMDGSTITEETLAKFDEHQNSLSRLLKERQVLEHSIKVAEARVEEVTSQIAVIDDSVQRLKRFRQKLEQNGVSIEEARHSTSKDRAKNLSITKENKRSNLQQLAEQHTEKIKHIEGDYEEQVKRLDVAHRELSSMLMWTCKPFEGNHIIFAVDKSGSMQGLRWSSLLTAYDAFKAVRSFPECSDKMSIVSFNNFASTEVMNIPLRTCMSRPLGPPRWGTSFAPAFREVQKCAQVTDNGFRVIVIFLTDGESSDTTKAARILGEMYEQMSYKSGLVTFGVMLENSNVSEGLKDLIKAGNGGQLYFEGNRKERHPLLLDANTANLSDIFRTIATTVSQTEYQTKRNLEYVKVRRDETKERLNARHQDTEAMFQRLREAVKMEAAELDACDAEDEKKLHAVYDRQTEMNSHQIAEVDDRLSQFQHDKRKLLAERVTLNANISTIEEQLECTKEAREKQTLAIQNFMKTECADELTKVHEAKKRVLENTGTTNERALSALMHATGSYLTMRQNDQVVSAEMDGAIKLVINFTESVVDKIERPFRIEEFPSEQKADLVFDFYRRHEGLAMEQPLRGISNMHTVIQHIARRLSGDSSNDNEYVKHVQCITEEFSCAELCDMNKDNIAQNKSDLENRLKKKIQESAKQLRTFQKKVTGIKLKKKRLSMRSDDVREKLENMQADVAEDKRVKLEERLQTMEEEMVDITQETKEAEAELEEETQDNFSAAFVLLKRVIDEFDTVFHKELSDLTSRHLYLNLASIMKQTILPLQEIIKVADACQQSMSTLADAPSADNVSVHNKECARNALASWREPLVCD